MADLLKASIGVEFKGQAGISQAAAAIGKTEVALKKMTPATGQATSALINLGRVAQDAPFGIIGIANNLNPLLESFQRTAKEAGGFGGALKALGASLLGGGGLGLALSLVTGAMSFFALQSNKTTKETKQLDEAAQKAAEAQREYQRAIDAASASTVSHAGEVANLRSILISTGSTLEALTQATLNQALTQYLFTQKRELLEKAIAETLKNQLKIAENTGENLGNFTFELEKASKISPIRLATDEDWRRTGKGLTDTEKKLLDINKIARTLGLSFTGVFDETFKQKAQKILDDYEFVDLKLKRPIQVEGATFDFKQAEKGTDLLKKVEYEFNDRLKSMEPLVVKPNIRLSQEVLDNIKIQEWLAKLPETLNKTIADGVKNIKIDALTGLGDAIGSAFSGGDLKSIFGNFLSVLGSGVQAIGKQIITLAVTAEALKKALSNIFKNPAGALIAGIGLVAVGSAIKNIANKGIAGARALGGPVNAGRTYLVGERGPELFTPGISGGIVPNNRMGSLGGSFGGGGVTEFRLRGTDLVAAMAATGRSQFRLV